jgi:hypothetical protein
MYFPSARPKPKTVRTIEVSRSLKVVDRPARSPKPECRTRIRESGARVRDGRSVPAPQCPGQTPATPAAFGVHSAFPQPRQMFRSGVFRPVDDPQILPPPALNGGLHPAPSPSCDIGQGLDDHAFAAALGKLQPPLGGRLHTGRIVQRHRPMGSGENPVRVHRR